MAREQLLTNQEILTQLHTGELLYLPDLTDPNTPNANATPGLISTREFFATFPQDSFTLTHPTITKAFYQLKKDLDENYLLSPAEIFLNSKNYNSYLLLNIFLTTGKIATQNDLAPHLAAIKQMKIRGTDLSPEDKLVTVPAAIIGFNVTEKSGGKDGINSMRDFQFFMNKLASGDFQGTFSPLCAQYGSQTQSDGTIFAYKLLEHVAENHVIRTMKWQNMLTLVHQLKHGSITQLWSTIAGDSDHIHSIVPKVIRQYAMENQLAKMFLLIDRHLTELQAVSNEFQQGITLTHLQHIEQQTEETLGKLFGENWAQLSKSQIDQQIYLLEKKENNLSTKETLTLQLARIAINDAYPGIVRFAGQHQETALLFENKTTNLDDDLANLSSEELAEWITYRGFSNFEDSQQFMTLIRNKLINQGEIGPAADAIHETVLYFTMGAYAAQENLLVIGLDIDHDFWMTIAWKFGYNYQNQTLQNSPTPILYARNPNTGKTDSKHAGKSYAEVYLAQRQFGNQPHQPLSNIPLREYFSL